MKRILVTGASGQVGSDLVPALRERYGADFVVAGTHSKLLTNEVLESGPSTQVDITDGASLDHVLKEYEIDTLYHLGAVLSASSERSPQLAHQVNINGLYNVLEAARVNGVDRVIIPSSIAAFGPGTPPNNTPNDTIQRPTSLYGISKVYGELMGNYYYNKFGLDVRGVRLPGLVSWKTEPTGGTTDYAAEACYAAVQKGSYTCYLKPGTLLPMMYMPDAVFALIQLAEADVSALQHHADFNLNAMSFAPEDLAEAIKRHIPGFTMDYAIDSMRQAIADSWPNSLDDSAARAEWGWASRYDLETMVEDMQENLSRKLAS
jgi:nucleoside-diphosphate-sugar epimerase